MGTFARDVTSPVDVLPLPFATVTSRSQFFSPKNRPRQAFSEARSASFSSPRDFVLPGRTRSLSSIWDPLWLRKISGEAIKGNSFSRHTFLFGRRNPRFESCNRETEKVPLKDKPIYIHFFIGDCDWFISEYDGEDLFFGYAIIGNPIFAEWGYISFTELKGVMVPPGFEVDCELFDLPLRASEIEEIKIY